MKTITLTFLFFLIGINMAFSQARRTEQQEKIAYIKKQFSESYATTRQAAIDTAGLFKVFVKHKQMFIGEKLSFLLDLLREYKVPIRFLSGSTTSPWIDPKGLAYVREITISYKDFYTIDELWNSDHP